MPTVDSLYTGVDQKQATKRVVIDGIVLPKVFSVDWKFSIGRVPTAKIVVPFPAAETIGYFSDVVIEAGFDGLLVRVFTGKVMNVVKQERNVEFHCAGLSQFLDKPSEDATVDINNTTNLIVLNTLFVLAGILDFEIVLPTTNLGVIVPTELQFSSFAEGVDKVAELDGGRWAELPSGLIRVAVFDPIPRADPNRTYFAMNLTALAESRPADLTTGRPRIRTIKNHPDSAKVKNRIQVHGATVPSGDDSVDIEATLEGPSPFVLNIDGSQAFNELLFGNDLVETQAKADDISERLLRLHNRLTILLDIAVDGDPLRVLGETIQVEDEMYTGTEGRFFLESYRTTMSQNDFITTLTVLGGEGGGTVVEDEDPVAAFTFCQLAQIVIDDRRYVVATFDARGSFSPSGVALSTFSWTDNQGPPVATGTGIVLTVRIDPTDVDPDPWVVTLTVTDANGNTDTAIITLPDVADCCETPCLSIAAPYLAFDTQFSASIDGAEFWTDQAGTAVRSVAAHPSTAKIAVYGTDSGEIHRTIDSVFTAPTLVLAAVGSAFVDITWDTEDDLVVWALTQDGRVYRSGDEGLTWAIFSELQVVFGLPSIRTNRIKLLGNEIFVFGGEGETPGLPLIAVDRMKDGLWLKAAIGGELLTDIAGANSDLFVADGDSKTLFEMAIILNSTNINSAVHYIADIFGDGTAWTRGTAQPAKSRGRWLARELEVDRFSFAYDDTVVYLGDVSGASMAVTVAAAALDAGDTPNHGIWMGEFLPGMGAVYLIAAEGTIDGTLYISWDRFASIGKVRPATGFTTPVAGSNAEMVTLGVAGQCPEIFAQQEDGSKHTARLNGGVEWVSRSTDTPPLDQNWHLIALQDPALDPCPRPLYRIADCQVVATNGGRGNLERSTDQGATWTVVIGQDATLGQQWGVTAVTMGPDGVLWAGTRTILNTDAPLRVYRSTDNGVTWQRILTGFEGTGFSQHRCIDIAVDPFNANLIAISCERFLGDEVVLISTNGGSSWISSTFPGGVSSDFGFWVKWGDQQRLLAAVEGGIATTDDFGGTWVIRDNLVVSAVFATAFLIRGPSPDQFVYAHELAVGAPEWRLRRSRDNGQSWEEIVNETDLYAAAGAALWSGVFLEDGSLLIATRPNALDGGGGAPVTLWRNPDPFANTLPPWENWTYNWHTLVGGASSLALQGLASILRNGD